MALFESLTVAAAWTGAFGTILASAVALTLSRRSSKVKLKASVGIQQVVGAGTNRTFVGFSVANLGERPVTISSLGWRIGKRRKKRRYGFIPFTDPLSAQIPKTLNYGDTATFFVLEKIDANWLSDYATDFIKSSPVGTLRGLLHTSVGHAEVIVPEDGFLSALRDARIHVGAH